MKFRNVQSLLICSTLLSLALLFFPQAVSAFHIELIPKRIYPGDAFMIKITGVNTSLPHVATVKEREFQFSRCGEGYYVSIAAVDISAKPGMYAVKVQMDRKTKKMKLQVKKKDFPKTNIELPEGKVSLSKEDLKRVNEEKRRVRAIFKTVSERIWDGNFIMPLDNEMSTEFGTERLLNNTWISVHRGIGIRGEEGKKIRASNNGKIVLADDLFFGGKTIILDHGQGVHTFYMHLSEFHVRLNEIISKGDVVGFVGSTGRSTGPHLHFGVKVMNINVNPLSIMLLQL